MNHIVSGAAGPTSLANIVLKDEKREDLYLLLFPPIEALALPV